MKDNAYKLIDELVNIIDDTNDLANKQNTINSLEVEKKENIKLLNELKDSMIDEKYIDMNREMADRNIEINTSKEIKKTNKQLKELEDNRQAIKNKIDIISDELIDLQNDYEKRNDYWSNIKEELISINKDFYDEEINGLNILNKRIEKQQQQFDALTKEYECLSIAIEDLQTDIKNKKNQLSQIKANLKNAQSYFDKDMQSSDLKEIENYNKKIENINSRIYKIAECPAILGYLIKEMIKTDDIYGALKKTKELAEKISKIIEDNKSVNYEECADELKILEEKEQDSNYGLIELDKEYIVEREDFINNSINELEKEKQYLEESLIKKLENKANILLATIQTLRIEEDNLNNMLDKYKNADIDEQLKSQIMISKENIIKNLENLRKIANNYRQDLYKLVKNKKIYKEEIINIDNQIIDYKKELEILIKINDSKTIYNIEEIETNKRRIKELQEALEQKKVYIQTDKSPSELYDQIEMVLGSLNLSDVKSIPKKSISFEKVNIEKNDKSNKAKITSDMHKVIEVICDLDSKNDDYVGIDEVVDVGGSVWN